MTKKYKSRLLGAAIIVAISLAAFKYSQAQSSSSSTDAADAIAVRIIPNPNHYSIVRWYESQGFSGGAPQALTVDGYEAIRDGRTVYVNAANIDPSARTIYTNIYLISYNQESTSKTVDILGQIVSHWKFNSNVTESTSPSPECSISATSCNSDSDCPKEQYCATSSAGVASSSCLLKTPKKCLVDTECPTGLFCDSIKARITRDIKRVGQLEELKEALYNFKQHNNYYPKLASGTYLANNSLSVWPSWTQSLLSEAAVSQNLLDPVNRLGACPGYDTKTCWNAESKRFVYSPSGNTLILPAGSYAFAYSTDSNGSRYNMCAVMESRATNLGYHFLPASTDPAASACVTATGIISGGKAGNTAPVLVDQFLIGQANREFSGFLKVVDAEDNPLTWSISGPSWVSLRDTSDPTQKKVYASSAATPGTYTLNLTVSDGLGGTLSTTTKITILADAPRIEAADAEYVLDPKVPFNYSFTFASKNLVNPTAAYAVSKLSGIPDILASLTKSFSSPSANTYKVTYSDIIPTSNKFYQDTTVNYRINLTDKNGVVFPKAFSIHVIVEQPQLNLDCPLKARFGHDYSCALGSVAQGNHTIAYTATGLPSGLSLSGTGDMSISGRPATTSAGQTITVKATNEYGASTSKAFVLKVNDYCGDGKVEAPNSENGGGIYNDGYEDCDGSDHIVSDPKKSSIKLQYGCRTEKGSVVPNPILTKTYCVFKSPTEGGGYCGDGYCQSGITAYGPESGCNCPQDCGQATDCSCKYTYSDWTACNNHVQTRTLLGALPGGCSGTPATSQSCGYPCNYTYSVWGACQSDHTQTRTVVGSNPANCVGTPVLSQACTITCNYTYGAWSACDSSHVQTRTLISTSPSGCSGTPLTSQTCVCDNDGVCDSNENIASCPEDCELIPLTCSPACKVGETCKNGTCITISTCTPNCTNKVCGDNGCGGSCGTCAIGRTCENGACIRDLLTCSPACSSYQTCVDGVCVSSGYCRGAYQCDVYTTPTSCKIHGCTWVEGYLAE